jgi:hypothetical protein
VVSPPRWNLDQLAKQGKGGYGFYDLLSMQKANALAKQAGCAILYEGLAELKLKPTNEVFGFDFLQQELLPSGVFHSQDIQTIAAADGLQLLALPL